MSSATRGVACGTVLFCLIVALPALAVRTKDPGSSRDGPDTSDTCDTSLEPTPFLCPGVPSSYAVSGDFTVNIDNYEWANDSSGQFSGLATILELSVTSGSTPVTLAYLEIKGSGLSKPGFVACVFNDDFQGGLVFAGTTHCVDVPLVSDVSSFPTNTVMQPQPIADFDNQLVHWSFTNFNQLTTMDSGAGTVALTLDGFINLPTDQASYLAVAYDSSGNVYCAGTLPGCPKVNPPPPATNDFIANAKGLAGAYFTTLATASTGVNVYATPLEDPNNPGHALPSADGTTDPSPVNCAGTGSGPMVSFSSLWYTYTPLEDGSLYLDTFTSSYDTVLSVYTKDGTGQLQEVACNDDNVPGEYQSALSLTNLVANTTYYIMVGEAPPVVDTEIDADGNPIVDGGGQNIKAATPLSSDQRMVLHGIFLGNTPVAVLTPSSLTFANQNVGTTSSPQNLTLSNIGNGTLNISSIVPSGDFNATSNCGTSLPGNSACTISVTFTPTQTGLRSGSVTVNDNDSSGSQTSMLSGTGVMPAVQLSPSSLNFPIKVIGKTSNPMTETLTNTGTGTLTISSITITGTNASEFAIPSKTCGATVAPGASCTINVTFAPAGKDTRTAALTIIDNASGSPHSVPITGKGTFVMLAPNAWDFGNQKVGTQSASKTFGITNTSTVVLHISSIQLSGQNPADFKITGKTCGSTLNPGKTCGVTAVFKPTATGLRKVNININDDGGASPQPINLSGTGTP